MTALSAKVAALTGTAEERLERLAGGDLSEVLLVRRPDGRVSVAKGGSATGTEAAMLRALAGAGVPAPLPEGELDGVLLLEHIDNDGVFSPHAWGDIGAAVARLHANSDESHGWPVDFRIGTIDLDNRRTSDWPSFWAERRLISTASVLDRPWRERVDIVANRIDEMLPRAPAASLLHGDLWTGNILVSGGKLAALIDPACYHGHREVDLAMLNLFDAPPDMFWEAYGVIEPGWEERRLVYQLFPALIHLRLFGANYVGMVDRLLTSLGA